MTPTITAFERSPDRGKTLRSKHPYDCTCPGTRIVWQQRLNGSGLLDRYANLSDYVARGEARPAYKRAFAAQLA